MFVVRERCQSVQTGQSTNGDRLSVVSNKNGKALWSSAVTNQRDRGVHHLQDVMKGQIGDVPDKGISN